MTFLRATVVLLIITGCHGNEALPPAATAPLPPIAIAAPPTKRVAPADNTQAVRAGVARSTNAMFEDGLNQIETRLRAMEQRLEMHQEQTQ